MKLSGIGSTRSTTQARSGQKASGGGFARELDSLASSGAPAEAAPAELGAVGSLGALLALQEVGDATEGGSKNRARKRGEAMLDKLEEIRHGLLTGTIPESKLHDLVGLIEANREQFSDPRLAEILDEIELRAKVELAKLGRLP